MKRLLLSVLLLSIACGDDDMSDSSVADLGVDTLLDVATDNSVEDAQMDVVRVQDALRDTQDAQDTQDDAPNTDPFASIRGACGNLVNELALSTPSYYEQHLDFADDGFDDPQERPLLTEDAQTILETPNAGGSSEVSEAFAMEVLARCEGARLLKTEQDIQYDPADSDKTDILVSVGNTKLGVSVTRAFAFPPERDYTLEDAQIVERKLLSILESSENVVAGDKWVKQSLVILAYAQMHADMVRAFYNSLPAATKSDTVMYVIVTDGDDDALY